MRHLDRYYRDHRGIVVHVIGYDSEKRQVIFRRTGYPYDCMQPLDRFRDKFSRVGEDSDEHGTNGESHEGDSGKSAAQAGATEAG